MLDEYKDEVTYRICLSSLVRAKIKEVQRRERAQLYPLLNIIKKCVPGIAIIICEFLGYKYCKTILPYYTAPLIRNNIKTYCRSREAESCRFVIGNELLWRIRNDVFVKFFKTPTMTSVNQKSSTFEAILEIAETVTFVQPSMIRKHRYIPNTSLAQSLERLE